jgi:hypothetical protein
VLAFAGYLLAVAGSGAALFVAKLGATPARVAEFYLGSPERFALPKSLAGLLEVAVPHLLAIPLALFVVSHLVGAAGALPVARQRALTAAAFVAALCGVGAGFLVRYLAPWLAWGKVAAFVGLEATLLAWIALAVAVSWPISAPSGRRAPAARERLDAA